MNEVPVAGTHSSCSFLLSIGIEALFAFHEIDE